MDASIREFYLATGMVTVELYGLRSELEAPWLTVRVDDAEAQLKRIAAEHGLETAEARLITELLERPPDEPREGDDDLWFTLWLSNWILDSETGRAWASGDSLPLPVGPPVVVEAVSLEIDPESVNWRIVAGEHSAYLPCGDSERHLKRFYDWLRARWKASPHTFVCTRTGTPAC